MNGHQSCILIGCDAKKLINITCQTPNCLHGTDNTSVQELITTKLKQEIMSLTADLYWSKDCRDIISWTPFVLQDIKADTTISIHCHTKKNTQL